jgi:hypothetical protein
MYNGKTYNNTIPKEYVFASQSEIELYNSISNYFQKHEIIITLELFDKSLVGYKFEYALENIELARMVRQV